MASRVGLSLLVALALPGCRDPGPGQQAPGETRSFPAPFKGSEAWDPCVMELPEPGPPEALVYRKVRDRALVQGRESPLPPEAVQVFVHEGRPGRIGVSGRYIAVAYEQSGVLFHRGSGEPVRRLTLADGWPASKPPEFAGAVAPAPDSVAGGCATAGIRQCPRLEPVELNGQTWYVKRPGNVLAHVSFQHDPPRPVTTWHAVLDELGRRAALVSSRDGREQLHTMADGLPGNIVTHLVRFGGTLWAASLDVYRPRQGRWGPGGLARLDPATGLWQRVQIQGQPVRWVSALQVVGNELWVAFRRGGGIAGDQVALGKRYWLGQYRPLVRRVVLARRVGEGWEVFDREPMRTRRVPPSVGLDDHTGRRRREHQPMDEPGVAAHRPSRRSGEGGATMDGAWTDGPRRRPRRRVHPRASTEQPVLLVRRGADLFVFSHTRRRKTPRGMEYIGRVSVLDTASGKWEWFDNRDDLRARQLYGLVAAAGEVLLASDRGAHRWDPKRRRWRWLDPRSPLAGGEVSAVAPVGDELWIGFANSFWSFGSQGLQRYGERSGRWSRIPPSTLGLRCPVHRIVPLPSGEVWVLFKQRWWMLGVGGGVSPAPPYTLLDCQRGLRGLRRLRDGQWRAPLDLRPVLGGLSVKDLAGLGPWLFALDDRGVHLGPDRWRTVARAQGIAMEPSPDGRRLRILRGQQVRRLYDPARGRLRRVHDPAKAETSGPRWVHHPQGRSLSPRGWLDRRRPVLVNQDGDRAVGPLGRTLVETVYAFWFVETGRLIRLDKAALGAGPGG